MKTGNNKSGKDTPAKSAQADSAAENAKIKDSRRRAVQNILAGTGAVAAGSQLAPTGWLKPVVDAVILPSHAQMSAPVNTKAAIAGAVGTVTKTTSVLDYFISASYAQLENQLAGACISFEIINGTVECSVSLGGGQVLNGQAPFTGSGLMFPVNGGGLSATVDVAFDAAIPPTSASGSVELGADKENFSAQEGANCTPIMTTTTTMAPEGTPMAG